MRGDADNPDEVLGVLNPATARAPDGKLYMFPRVVAAGNYSRVGIAEIIFDAAGEPTGVERRGYALEPTESYEQNAHTAGCEDARISYIEPLRRYVMTYTAYGPLGARIALAASENLIHWERLGPVKFEHYTGKSALERSDTQPLLKLWLKFENVSLDQTFSPLDDLLIFKRSNPNQNGTVFANNFLVAADNRKRGQSIFHVYDMPQFIRTNLSTLRSTVNPA